MIARLIAAGLYVGALFAAWPLPAWRYTLVLLCVLNLGMLMHWIGKNE